MHSLGKLTFACFISASLTASAASQLLTFDDIPTVYNSFDGSISAQVTNGYQGFQWENFYALDAVDYQYNPSGYLNGMISAKNVVLNWGAVPASIFLNGATFDLNSAYVTSAWYESIALTVQGFKGGVMTYENTYTIYFSGPTFLDFEYQDVDRVTFLSFPQFGLDNLTVTVPEPGVASILVLVRLYCCTLEQRDTYRDNVFKSRYPLALTGRPKEFSLIVRTPSPPGERENRLPVSRQ